MRVEQLQHFELERGDAGVVDERRSAQGGEPRLERGRRTMRARFGAFGEIGHRLDVEVQHVEEQPARRAVGARVRRVVRKERVQRIDADDAGAARAPIWRRSSAGR